MAFTSLIKNFTAIFTSAVEINMCIYYFTVYNIRRIIYLVLLIDFIIIFSVTEEILSQF